MFTTGITAGSCVERPKVATGRKRRPRVTTLRNLNVCGYSAFSTLAGLSAGITLLNRTTNIRHGV